MGPSELAWKKQARCSSISRARALVNGLGMGISRSVEAQRSISQVASDVVRAVLTP
jgi:hypothetical protein